MTRVVRATTSCLAVVALQVISLVEGMLQMRLRFIPDPHAQERYLQGAVAEVLSAAHGRITRILQQADLFKNITGTDWLFKVGCRSALSWAPHTLQLHALCALCSFLCWLERITLCVRLLKLC